MGQPGLSARAVRFRPPSEAALKALAGRIAREWRARSGGPLLIGLLGDLGAGKTTWVRGMLEGLGYGGRVPSPTYTLLEHYALPGLDLVHVDLYRLGGEGADPDARGELETLGIRDWLSRERCWLLVEWPERSAELRRRCDLLIELGLDAEPDARCVTVIACSTDALPFVEGLSVTSEIASS